MHPFAESGIVFIFGYTTDEMRLNVLSVILTIGIIGLLIGCTLNTYDRVKRNYGREVDRLAKEFDLPAPYLKALIILESSGREIVPPRFEQGVYNDLVALKAGKEHKLETFRSADVQDASDAALRNLASSWGPFQLMGYKCKELGVEVRDIRGENTLYWSIYWINKNYGNYLREKKYEAAFRIHNTGSPTGRTHDPNYVKNGLLHMQYFEKNK